jgi:Kef-type K+ transport system membrane component KefB
MSGSAAITRPELPHARPWRLVIGYGLMLAVAVALFLLIRSWGETLAAPAPSGPSTSGTPHAALQLDALLHVLLALLAIVVLGSALSKVFAYLHQPRVIGEVVAGILLGPSFLGRFSPEAMSFLLPAEVAPYLGILAQLGVILYMFLVGLELNAELLRGHGPATVAISHSSIIVPFVLGAALALWLFPRLAPAGVSFTSFALFLGVAMAITAFPVLARILTDRRMDRTDLGVMALSCAAAGDITAWCLLAFVAGIAQAEVGGALGTTLLALGYVALMFILGRPLATRLLGRSDGDHLPPGVVAAVLVTLLCSSLAAEAIGIHALFGAFLLGAVIPHDSAVARVFSRKVEDIVSILLLPAFFAYTGMRVQIGLVAGLEQWLICGLIIVVATAGKLGGTLAAARLTGLSWRTSASLGMLMNTRGLMEVIVLNLGLDLGVISPTLFTMMVLMALVTTMMTAPVLHFLNPLRALPVRAAAPQSLTTT